jgi:hypothetical protein
MSRWQVKRGKLEIVSFSGIMQQRVYGVKLKQLYMDNLRYYHTKAIIKKKKTTSSKAEDQRRCNEEYMRAGGNEG